MKRRLYGDKHPEIANALENLASALQDKGDLARAEPLYRQALAMWRELLGDTHPEVANALHNLASLQYDRGDTRTGAREPARIAGDLSSGISAGPSHGRLRAEPDRLLADDGRQYGEADSDIQEALAMRRRLLGDRHPGVASSQVVLATLQVASISIRRRWSRRAARLTSIRGAVGHPLAYRSRHERAGRGAYRAGPLRRGGTAAYPERRDTGQRWRGAAVFRALNERYLDTLHRREQQASAVKLTSSAALNAPAADGLIPPPDHQPAAH